MRILLVEDDPDDVELVRMQLDEWDSERFDVEVVPRLSDAIEQVETQDFDVVLLDLSLSDSRGIETLARLRPAAKDAAIVVMTGDIDERVSLDAAEHGADAYLVKGDADPSLLVRTLSYAARRYESTRRAEAERLRSEHRATHDALTGLPNRLLFDDRLEQAVASSRRTRRLIGLLFVDLDHFKEVNDRLGHAAGDALLAEVGKRLAGHVRASDTVARLGGDEFAVLLTHVRERGDVQRLAEKLRREIEKPVDANGHVVHPSASIGIAVGPEPGESPDALLAAADAAMYEAKRGGRGRVRLAREDEGLAQRSALASALSKLACRYEPRYDLSSGAAAALELIPSAETGAGRLAGRALLSAAEEAGLADTALASVVECIARDAREHAALTRVGVVAIPWVRGLASAESLGRALERTPLPAGLTLELMVPVEHAVSSPKHGHLAELRRPGVHLGLAIGHEVAGLRPALKQLDPDTLQLDVRWLPTAATGVDDAFARAFIGFLVELGLPWGVCGLEQPGRVHELRELGARTLQGPALRGPVDARDLDASLQIELPPAAPGDPP